MACSCPSMISPGRKSPASSLWLLTLLLIFVNQYRRQPLFLRDASGLLLLRLDSLLVSQPVPRPSPQFRHAADIKRPKRPAREHNAEAECVDRGHA